MNQYISYVMKINVIMHNSRSINVHEFFHELWTFINYEESMNNKHSLIF
jgi:hypothetical protein